MIEKLACFVNKHKADEKANIELALLLCESNNQKGIEEIVAGLNAKNKDIANDCIKVLYEVGERKPLLISSYANELLQLLNSRNNRIVWGSMSALATIAEYNVDLIFDNLDIVLNAYKSGSVITVDHSITVLAKLCNGGKKYEDKVFPILIRHLETCRIKEIPQHAERMLICINEKNKDLYLKTIDSKTKYLSSNQLSRVNKIKKQLM